MTVKAIVGTAASSMPRLPPSAWESWARTTASTVSVAHRPLRRALTTGVDGVAGRAHLGMAHCQYLSS